MSAETEALSRELAQKEEALAALRAERALLANSAEIAGDWAMTEETLVKEISELKASLAAAIDDDA